MDQPPLIDNAFGPILIGVILGAMLCGVSCAQAFYYFLHYNKKDGLGIKAIVVITLISDTVHQALISHTIYTYTITYYSQPQKLGNAVWSLTIQMIFNGITALLVQAFFVARIWKFSQRNVIVTAILSVFILGGFVFVIVCTTNAIKVTTFAEFIKFRPFSVTVNILAATGDVLITIVSCVLLYRTRTGLRSSNTMINLLIAFSVQTGVLTTLCAISSLIFIIASPNTFIYICLYFLTGRLYCNSLLATLNVRNAIRGRGHCDPGISLNIFGNLDSSTANNHKEVDAKGKIPGVET